MASICHCQGNGKQPCISLAVHRMISFDVVGVFLKGHLLRLCTSPVRTGEDWVPGNQVPMWKHSWRVCVCMCLPHMRAWVCVFHLYSLDGDHFDHAMPHKVTKRWVGGWKRGWLRSASISVAHVSLLCYDFIHYELLWLDSFIIFCSHSPVTQYVTVCCAYNETSNVTRDGVYTHARVRGL